MKMGTCVILILTLLLGGACKKSPASGGGGTGNGIGDVYFWNADPNVPPSDAPDSLLDQNGTKTPSGFWYGKNTASWTASLENYYSMLQQTGNQGIITVNYGYARYGTGANPVAAAA